MGRETERQYTTTRLEYERKLKEQTIPSPSELKREETKEFVYKDVKGVVQSAAIMSKEEFEKHVVQPLRLSFEEQLEETKKETEQEAGREIREFMHVTRHPQHRKVALEEAYPQYKKEQIKKWETEQKQKFEEYLQKEIYPRRLPTAGKQWIKKPYLPRLSDIFYQQAAKQRLAQQKLPPLARSDPRVQMLTGAGPAGTWEFYGGVIESGESLMELVFPAPAPPPPRPFTAQRIAGIVAGSYATGKVISWVVEPAITPAARHYLTSKYLRAMEKGKIEWAGWKEKLVMRLTGVKPHVASQIVDIPEFAKIGPVEMAKQQMAWELAGTPRTSALLITKYTGPTGKRASAWVMEHWFKRVTGGLSYALVKSELEQVKPIAPETRKGLPHIPKVEPLKEGHVPSLAGILSAKMLVKPTSPQKLTVLPKFSTKQISEVVQIQKISGITTTKQKQYLKTETFQKTQTFQKTVAKTVGIQFTQPRKPKLPPKLGRKKKRKRKTVAPMFGWVRLEWPVAGPEKVLETVIGEKRK